jgi:hypothetical protein
MKKKARGAEISAAELRESAPAIRMAQMIAKRARVQGASDQQIQNFLTPVAFDALALLLSKTANMKQRPKITARGYAAAKKKARTRKELASLLGVSGTALRKYEKKN